MSVSENVVLSDLPLHTTVAGTPARVVGKCTVADPALELDANLSFALEGGGGISCQQRLT